MSATTCQDPCRGTEFSWGTALSRPAAQAPSLCSLGMALCLNENTDRASTLSTKCQNCLAVWGVKHMGDSFYLPHGVLGGTCGIYQKISAQIKLGLHSRQAPWRHLTWRESGWGSPAGLSPYPGAGHQFLSSSKAYCNRVQGLPLSYSRLKVWSPELSTGSICTNHVDPCKYLLNWLCSQGTAVFPLPSERKFITQSNR